MRVVITGSRAWSYVAKGRYRHVLGWVALLLLNGCGTEFEACQPQGAGCQQETTQGIIQLEVDSIPLQSLRPLTVKVRSTDPELTPQELHITGASMYMGYQQVKLRPEADYYLAEVILPMCTQSRMTWRWQLRTEQGTAADFFIQSVAE